MYTEEEEFDYNQYLNENDGDNSGNSPFNTRVIIKIALIVLILILLIFFVFKIKNRNYEKKEENNNQPGEVVDGTLAFNSNLTYLREIAEKYYFTDGNYPKEVKDNVKLNINDLIGKGLLTDLKDGGNTVCGYNASYINMTRNVKDYLLEINLSCIGKQDKVKYYYDLDFNCLTCKGEAYISPSEDDKENDTSDNNQNSNENNNNSSLICNEFGPWTDEYKSGADLVTETRTLVKAYKDNYVYGNWSTPTETPITGNDSLEVKTVQGVKTVSTLSGWSELSTSKPESIPGREIKTSTKTSSYYETSCKTETYTVTRKTWDASASKCVSKKIGEVTCTYTKTTCPKVKKTKTITYYQYQDTINKNITTTYYSSRTVSKQTDYTDYILESEIPEGYQKVIGSEKVQYRYKEKCSK